MQKLLLFLFSTICFSSWGQERFKPQATELSTVSVKSDTVPLPSIFISAHQQLTTLSSKGEHYRGGVEIDPGRQIAVYYPNPDTLKSHIVKGISVLIERKFSYGRLKVNLRLPQHGNPAEKNELTTAYYILPTLVDRHHTWVTFTLPDGFVMPKDGIFVSIEGMTASDDEKCTGITSIVKKAVTSDGSSRVDLMVRIQDNKGSERLVNLNEFPNLVSCSLSAEINSNTWVKISPNPRFQFKRNSLTKLGNRVTAYDFATQLTLVSW